MPPEPARWLLLLHQVPTKPDYVRVKIGRRLQRIGALPLRNGVHVLPAGAEALEDLSWTLGEVVAAGGEGILCEARLLQGADDTSLLARFREPAPRVVSLRSTPAVAPSAPTDWVGRVWVTRVGVKVDRIASAWLIRRFVDPAARFRFVPPEGHVPAAGELRFDMVPGEVTHEGDLCTFEVLLARLGAADPALRALAEIVHDIDLRDARHGRPETAGVAAMVDGIAAGTTDDEERLRQGFFLFDALHRALGAAPR